ncbi:hypothetical protein ABZ752_04350 [Streptomyces roseifaciens]
MTAVLTVLAALVTNVRLTGTAAHAVNKVGSSPFATYNMHGSGNGMNWRAEIERLTAHNVVVALQGVGSDRYVCFLQTDPRRTGAAGQDTWDCGQMNLAAVTDSRADEVRVLENPRYDPGPNAPNSRYRARPPLGLRFGNTWYWNTHVNRTACQEGSPRPFRGAPARPRARGLRPDTAAGTAACWTR